jgi:hypothetical protein
MATLCNKSTPNATTGPSRIQGIKFGVLVDFFWVMYVFIFPKSHRARILEEITSLTYV